MSTASTDITPQAPTKRRTVLMALSSEFATLKSGIYDVGARAGWTVLDLRYYMSKVPLGCRPDGVLFILPPDYGPLVRRFLRLGVPVVQIDDHVLAQKCCCVIQDRRAIGRAAAEHFADRGFRNMAYLHSEDYEHSTDELIGQSFVERARGLGARADLIAVQQQGRTVPWERAKTLAERFRKEISRLQLPLGIFTYHDAMAVRICGFCDAVGLRVPEQVAVLGRGNDLYQCDFAPTPLSSVDPNYFTQGRAAAEPLDSLMDGEPAPKEPILIPPAGVVTRQSTDVLALPDLDTARALRYIWEHFSEPLQVSDIADAIAVSRRKLERHFQSYLHRGVNEELVRKRLERACELLAATRTRVKVISEQVGFTTEKHFFKAFRKVMGTSPRQYRLAQTARPREAENDGTGPAGGQEALRNLPQSHMNLRPTR
jgi:LacI family transcriptional regulator